MSDDRTHTALANTTPAAAVGAGGSLPLGALIAGRWTVVRFLAAGGMGEVYEAHDRLLDTPVALKILPGGVSHERFVRELQLARKVSHPGVCRLHDAGSHDGVSFPTMELLDGEPLSARIDRGRLSLEEAAPLLSDLAAALDAAHAAGVIHRDFKPHNVMLIRRSGATRAMITDFGIARPADDDGAPGLTGANEIIGTPAYMAPEQISGHAVTPATDTYSFGVVAYQMLTGALPFTGANARELATARLTTAPRPLREHVPDLDRGWEAAILACLAVDPAARPVSASAVLALAAAPPPRRGRPSWLLPAAVLGAATIAVAVWMAIRPGAGAQASTADAAISERAIDRAGSLVHYERGREHFENQRFDEAIIEFMQVDEQLRTPAMLFNMAQAYRLKGDPHQALYFFRRFQAAPGPQDVSAEGREIVAQHIADLEAALANGVDAGTKDAP